jgi:PAS domain S-box-containing protein
MDASMANLLREQAPDAIIFAAPDGVIREWNAAAEAIFGFTNDEALGQSLDVIIPEQFREAHWKGFERALAAGETKYKGKALPTRAMKKGGSTIYVELSFAIIVDADGKRIGALAHARNITERWEADREQRRRLRELEAQLGKPSEQA